MGELLFGTWGLFGKNHDARKTKKRPKGRKKPKRIPPSVPPSPATTYHQARLSFTLKIHTSLLSKLQHLIQNRLSEKMPAAESGSLPSAPPAGPSGGGQAVSGDEDDGPRTFKFPSHQSHMVTLAKMCREKADYTDCVIQCAGSVTETDTAADADDDDNDGTEDNKLRAHRLVLGAVSPFMKLVFSEVPASLPEATILVPGVRRRVVKALLDFLYTGEMKVEREDTAELQLLIETLQIDPGLISVECLNGGEDDSSSEDEEEDIGDGEVKGAEAKSQGSEVKDAVGAGSNDSAAKQDDENSKKKDAKFNGDDDQNDQKGTKRKNDGPSQDDNEPATSLKKVPKVANQVD